MRRCGARRHAQSLAQGFIGPSTRSDPGLDTNKRIQPVAVPPKNQNIDPSNKKKRRRRIRKKRTRYVSFSEVRTVGGRTAIGRLHI